MTPDDFCRWLKPLIDRDEAAALTREQTTAIRQNLSSVFQHVIDPAMGDAAHQAMLNRVHSGR